LNQGSDNALVARICQSEPEGIEPSVTPPNIWRNDELKKFKNIERIIRNNKKELEEKYGLEEIGIFGSYVRGEQNQNSDIDILVKVRHPMGFAKFLRLEDRISQLLGIKADMVTEEAMKSRIHIGERISEEVRYVW